MLNKLGKEAIDNTQSGLSELDQNLKECQDLSSISSLSVKEGDFGSQRNILSFPLKNNQQNCSMMFTEEHLIQNKLRSSVGMESLMGLISSQQSKQNANKKVLVKARRRKGKGNELKEFMLTQKANILKDQFLQKIRRNNQYSTSIQYHHEEENKTFLDRKGYSMREHGQKIISIFSIFNIISTIFIATLSFVFPEIKESQLIQLLELFGSTFFTFEILINFITLKFSMGKKLETLRQISKDYFHSRFPVDALNLLALLFNIAVQHPFASYSRFFCFLKLQDCVEKMQRLEVYFIENYYNQQYWSLVKVFLFNFCFAHMLAIALLAMSNLSQNDNWIVNKHLISRPWFERYIWSYYWGTTIMLTIGFGDIVPSNWQEALCMVFIETISCIVLAYNISCVGTLISNIRSQDVEKSKNLKIFKKLADKHGITESLASKISNYIEQHANIKKLFNIQEQVQLVQKLPSAYRVQYLKEANKKMFQHLFFFNSLMQKTLFALAEKIQMKITHPEQLILTTQNSFEVFILKHGQVGFISRKINRKFNKYVFDCMKVKENASPFLLNTNFITKNRSFYGIKSLVYSVLYYLEQETFTETLRETHIDYQLYCRMKDKNKNKIDEFQVFPCEFCPKRKHTKFSCPKLHYIPLQQHKIIKYISKQKKDKNQRMSCIDRVQTPKESALAKYLSTKQIYNQKKNEQQNALSFTKKLKRQRFILDQLRFIDNQKVDPQQLADGNNFRTISGGGDDIAKIQSKFLEATTQVIRMSINKALGVQKGQDEVWLLDLDRMKNYKDYFPQSNPLNLVNLFNVQQRLQKVIENNLFEVISKACGTQSSKGIMSHINNLKLLKEPSNSKRERKSVAQVLQINLNI